MQPRRYNNTSRNYRYPRTLNDYQSTLIDLYMEHIRLSHRAIYETNMYIHNTERTLNSLLNANVPMSSVPSFNLLPPFQEPSIRNQQDQTTDPNNVSGIFSSNPFSSRNPSSRTYGNPIVSSTVNIPLTTTYVPRDPSGGRIRQQWMHSFFDNVVVTPTETHIRNAIRDVSYVSIPDPIYTMCPISMEPFNSEDTVSQIIHCGHFFGQQSLVQWFGRNVRCPLCRYDIRESPVIDASANSVSEGLGNHEENPEYVPGGMDLSSNILRNILRPIARPGALRGRSLNVMPNETTSSIYWVEFCCWIRPIH